MKDPMKKTNIRAGRNGGSKVVPSQVPKSPDRDFALADLLLGLNPPTTEQGGDLTQTTPPWLTNERLAQLKVLASNQTRFGLKFETIRTLAREFRVELKPGNDGDLTFMMELGWVDCPDCDDWRITDEGRAALSRIVGKAVPALNANLPPAPAASVSESQLDPRRLSELEEASDQVAGLFELLERQFQEPLDLTPEGRRGLVQLGIKSCSRLREAVIGVGGAR